MFFAFARRQLVVRAKRLLRERERLRQRYAEDPEYRERRKVSKRLFRAAHKAEINERVRLKCANDPEFRNSTNRRKTRGRYNLTDQELAALEARYNGVCPICLLKKKLQVEHCHKTRIVRGLTCRKCNSGGGFFNDDPEIMRRAAEFYDPRRYMKEPSR
jgi:Recombination endonuclease VII